MTIDATRRYSSLQRYADADQYLADGPWRGEIFCNRSDRSDRSDREVSKSWDGSLLLYDWCKIETAHKRHVIVSPTRLGLPPQDKMTVFGCFNCSSIVHWHANKTSEKIWHGHYALHIFFLRIKNHPALKKSISAAKGRRTRNIRGKMSMQFACKWPMSYGDFEQTNLPVFKCDVLPTHTYAQSQLFIAHLSLLTTGCTFSVMEQDF